MLVLGPPMAAGAVSQPCCPCHPGLFLLALFILAAGQGAPLLFVIGILLLDSRLVGFVFLVWKGKKSLAVGTCIFFNLKEHLFLKNFFHLHPKYLDFFF